MPVLTALPSARRPALSHRDLFRQAADHAARYRDTVGETPPWPTVNGEALRLRFDGPTPQRGLDADLVIDALVHAAEPGLSAPTGPRFFGWVIGGSHPAGVAADMLTAAWGQNAGNHVCSAAAAMAERVSAGWLLDLLRLPPESSIGFVSGATMAGFVCLAAARNEVLRRAGWDVEADGLIGAPPMRVFVGDDVHTTILSALRYLGLGGRPTRIATDAEGRMDAAALETALAAGEGPAIVIAQAGQINTGAFDPFTEVAAAARAHGAWLHIDGAFGLWARVLPELNPLTAGIELADSWSVDGHKWLQTPYDSGFAIVRDPAAHQRAMSVTASYLPQAGAGEYNPGEFAPELSRRARGFAVWAVIKALGREGVVELVRRHCALARRVAEQLAAEPGLTVLNDVVLNQVIVGFETDDLARATIAQLKADNLVLAGGADWRGRHVLRLSIISAPLTESDIDRLARAILAAHATAKSTPLPESPAR